MSVISSRSSTNRGVGQLCVGCHVLKLRSNEQHDSCFDCLDHGPQTPLEQRCEICSHWLPRHFQAATHYYPPDSPARLAALALVSAEQAREDPPFVVPDVPFPRSLGVGVSGGESVLAGSGVGGVAPPLSATPAQISQRDLSLLASVLSFIKGPQLPGLPALLQQGVPAGNPVPPSGQAGVVPHLPDPEISEVQDPDPSPSQFDKRVLEASTEDLERRGINIKKVKGPSVGMPVNTTALQDKVAVQVEVHAAMGPTEGATLRSDHNVVEPSTQAVGSDHSDQGHLHPPSGLSGSSHDYPGRDSRESRGQGRGQSSSVAHLSREVDTSGRGCDQQVGHHGVETGQTGPNVIYTKSLPFPAF